MEDHQQRAISTDAPSIVVTISDVSSDCSVDQPLPHGTERKQQLLPCKIYEDELLDDSIIVSDSESDDEIKCLLSPQRIKPPHQDHTYIRISCDRGHGIIRTYSRLDCKSDGTFHEETTRLRLRRVGTLTPSRSPNTKMESELSPRWLPYVLLQRLDVRLISKESKVLSVGSKDKSTEITKNRQAQNSEQEGEEEDFETLSDESEFFPIGLEEESEESVQEEDYEVLSEAEFEVIPFESEDEDSVVGREQQKQPEPSSTEPVSHSRPQTFDEFLSKRDTITTNTSPVSGKSDAVRVDCGKEIESVIEKESQQQTSTEQSFPFRLESVDEFVLERYTTVANEQDVVDSVMKGIRGLWVKEPPRTEHDRRSSHFKMATHIYKIKRRRNFCPYCDKMVTNFSRHLVDIHRDVKEVQEYIALSSESPRRRKRLRAVLTNRLRNIGNFRYNKQIVEGERIGEFLPMKRSSHDKNDVNRFTHVTCKHCMGFIKKNIFYRHLANCPAIVGETQEAAGEEDTTARNRRKKKVLQHHADLLVRDHTGATKLLNDEVFPTMQKDEETAVVQGDPLISRYGSNFRFTHRGNKQIHYCSSRMRSLARLFITMRQLKPDLRELRDCITPNNFNVLVESVRRMSRFDDTSGQTKTPSVPPRLCSSLKSCANIVLSDTIKDDSLSREKKGEIMSQMNDFLHLMNKDWATEVSANSENSRKRMKVMKDDLLPEPEDIRTFSSYIHTLCPVYVSALKSFPNDNNYEKLAKLIIGHIITLNRRRPNETAEIPIEAYRSTLNRRSDYGYDVQNVLTEEELRTGQALSIFYIPANKNMKKVPILLTKTFHEAIEALIASRSKLGIKSKYLFARPGPTKIFDGTAVLRSLSNAADLKNPSTFTANALRHHAATSSQLMPRNENYTKRLSKFLGHDLSTHESFYEMPLPLVQKSIVGHQLLKMTLPKDTKKGRGGTVVSCTVTSEGGGDKEQDKSEHTREKIDDSYLGGSCTENINFSNVSDDEESTDLIRTRGPETDCKDDPMSRRKKGNKQKGRGAGEFSELKNTDYSDFQYDDDLMCRRKKGKKQKGRGGGETSEPKNTEYSDFQFNDAEDIGHIDSTETCKEKKIRRTRWSLQEKMVVYEHFGRHIYMNVKPTRKEVERVWKKEQEVLQNRTLDQLVAFVNNTMHDKKRISTPLRKKIKNMVVNKRDILSP